MILNKYYFLVITILFLSACEENNPLQECTLHGIHATIQATSYTEWKYLSVTEEGLIELDPMSDEEAFNSNEWDIAMMRNHFRTNSGESGSGNAGAFMIDGTWSCDSFNELNEVPNNTIFVADSMLTNIYQPWEHNDPDYNPDDVYVDAPGNTILENWGWFDIDADYYFYYTHKKFIVKLPNFEEEEPRYIKLWPYQYYGELGQSAHTSLIYDFINPPE